MRRLALIVIAALALLATLAVPAAADHTNPDAPISPTPEGGRQIPGGAEFGVGEWTYGVNFPSNPSSDHWFFTKDDRIFSTSGTLGGGAEGHVGQRILQLTDEAGGLAPQFVADHGSAACNQPSATGNLGLQHDSSVTPFANPELLLDATDSTGRCHDTAGGGIEIIDISGLDQEGFEVREIGLVRFDNTTHTLTVDTERPWIVYSNNSTTRGNGNYNDVMDIRSCLTTDNGGTLAPNATLEEKRESCDPIVHRIPFKQIWTQGTQTVGGEPTGNAGACHDTVSAGDRLYCSGGFGEVVFDVGGLTDADGNINGTPLNCTRLADFAGEDTGALVTDCTGNDNPDDEVVDAQLEALGVEFLGSFNHVGFAGPVPNTNTMTPSDQGVAFSHETRPLPAGIDRANPEREFIIISDERGGGALPGGATCTDSALGLGDEFGNGGLHVLDITDPANIAYAENTDGERAVWQGLVRIPSSTFCVVHRFQIIPDEQRVIMGYYSQGVKIMDYEVIDGQFQFTEVASMILEGANSWTTDSFRITDNDDGTRTYDMLSSDIQRGVDTFSWTGPTAVSVPEVEAPADDRIVRVSGTNRITTAIEVSREGYESADTVVLARADDFADALAGAPLAASLDAPILLNSSDRLLPEVEAEIERLGADTAIILGGESAQGRSVALQLEANGLDVERVSASNRFGTAAAIAERMGGQAASAFLTEGINDDPARGWPDAMSAAPYAAHTNRPILLTARGLLPPETSAALSDLATSETIVVGGPGAVSDEVVAEVRAAGHGPRRLAGANRFETSRVVYEEGLDAGMDPAVLWLATGANFPDALAAGAVVGARGDTLLLVSGTQLANSPATRDVIRDAAADLERVNLLGGTSAISEAVRDEIAQLLGETAAADAGASDGDTDDGATPTDNGGGLLLGGLFLLPLAALAGRRRRGRALP